MPRARAARKHPASASSPSSPRPSLPVPLRSNACARRELFRLDAAYLDDCARLAERARDATRTAGAPAVAAGRSHAEVDLWDGRALALADIVVAAFAKAHAVDARVPKH